MEYTTDHIVRMAELRDANKLTETQLSESELRDQLETVNVNFQALVEYTEKMRLKMQAVEAENADLRRQLANSGIETKADLQRRHDSTLEAFYALRIYHSSIVNQLFAMRSALTGRSQ